MSKETITARYQQKDGEGNVMLDDEGKAIYREGSVVFDFGDNLDAAVALCSAEVVHSNYVANAKVGLQSILRAKMKAGMTPDAIQSVVDGWKPGMVMAKSQVDPIEAAQNAFATWPAEKQKEFLEKLGVKGGKLPS